jgi:hypothetical protein
MIWIWGSHRLAEEDAIVGNNSSAGAARYDIIFSCSPYALFEVHA